MMMNSISLKPSSKRIKRLVIVLLVLLNIACDQISKTSVRNNVAPNSHISLVEEYFILTNVENTGAMLGFGKNLSPVFKLLLLQALPVLVLVILLYRIVLNTSLNHTLSFAFACVIGGGIGNIIDRIIYGSVTDFFHIKIGFLKTGIFNMADVSVTLGAILILILSLRKKNITI